MEMKGYIKSKFCDVSHVCKCQAWKLKTVVGLHMQVVQLFPQFQNDCAFSILIVQCWRQCIAYLSLWAVGCFTTHLHVPLYANKSQDSTAYQNDLQLAQHISHEFVNIAIDGPEDPGWACAMSLWLYHCVHSTSMTNCPTPKTAPSASGPPCYPTYEQQL